MRSGRVAALCLLIVVAQVLTAQEKKPAEGAAQSSASVAVKPKGQSDIYFGLPSDKWDQFIICGQSMHPDIAFGSVPMRLAFVDASGKACHLKWLKDRKEGPNSSLRELSCPFEEIGGYLFQSVGKCPIPEESNRRPVLLVSEDYLKSHTPMKVTKYPPKPLDKDTITRIEKERKGKIDKAWDIATLEDGSKCAVVLFSPANNRIIYSVALLLKTELVFDDDEDDGELNWLFKGNIFEETFEILAAFRSPSGIDIARRTPGYEGLDSVFTRQKGKVFEDVAANAFYAGGF